MKLFILLVLFVVKSWGFPYPIRQSVYGEEATMGQPIVRRISPYHREEGEIAVELVGSNDGTVRLPDDNYFGVSNEYGDYQSRFADNGALAGTDYEATSGKGHNRKYFDGNGNVMPDAIDEDEESRLFNDGHEGKFGPGFNLNKLGAHSRVITLTEYPNIGYLREFGSEYADQGLSELNYLHTLGVGVNPGIVKSTSFESSGYDFHKVLENFDDGFSNLEAFDSGPNQFRSLGQVNGMEGFHGVDRGTGFYGFGNNHGDLYGTNAGYQMMPGDQGQAVGPIAIQGTIH